MAERHLRRFGRQPTQRLGECLGLLRRDAGLGTRRERRRAEPEVAVVLSLQPLQQPPGRLLDPAELLQPPGQLLCSLLRVEVGELDLLLREELARLQLQQRADEDEELAAGVEIEPLAFGETLDEGDHDVGDVDVPRLQLLAQDEGEQQVERPLERVEVELELPNVHAPRLAARADAALGDGHGRALRDLPGACASRSAGRSRGRTATRRRTPPSTRRGQPRPRSSAAHRRSGATGRPAAAPRTCARTCRRRRRARRGRAA